MTSFWSERRTIVAILGLTAGRFILGMCLLFLLWIVLRRIGLAPSFWAMTEALATAVTAAAVLGGAALAVRELAEAAANRHMTFASTFLEELNSKDNIAARRWVYQNLAPDPTVGLASLSDEGRDAIRKVLYSLDRIAVVTAAGAISDDFIMPWLNSMIIKTWAKLGPYVMYERVLRGEPDYYLEVDGLIGRSIAWRKENLPEAQITWVQDAL
jgi:hypothetical protein